MHTVSVIASGFVLLGIVLFGARAMKKPMSKAARRETQSSTSGTIVSVMYFTVKDFWVWSCETAPKK